MNTAKLKCAVIGVGYLGKFHAEKYSHLPQTELVAVCDNNIEQARIIAEKHNVPAYNNYAKMLSELKIDAVSIVVPTSLHYVVAEYCLQNNVHVLLEKPITTTVAEANQLNDLATNKNLVLQIGHLERFNSVVTKMQESLHNQQPIFIEAKRMAPYKLRATDVSVVLDLMIHDIDLVHYLVKSPLVSIQAQGIKIVSPTWDVVHARLTFANGCCANLTANRTSPKPERSFNLLQNEAYFISDLDSKKLLISRKNHQPTASDGTTHMLVEELQLEKNDAILEEISAFANSIQNQTPAVVSGLDGKQALETAIAISELLDINKQ